MNIKEFKVVTSIKLDKSFKPVSMAYRRISVVRDKISATGVLHYTFGLQDGIKPSGFVYSEPTVTHPSGVLRYVTIMLNAGEKYMKIDESSHLYWQYLIFEHLSNITWVDLNKTFDLEEYLSSLFTPYSVSSASDVLMLSQVDKSVALFASNYKDSCLVVPQNVKYLYIDTKDNPKIEHVYLSSDLEYIAVRNDSLSDFISSIISDILGSDVTTANLIVSNNAAQPAVAPCMRIKGVLHTELRGVTVPEVSLTSRYSEIARSNIPVIQLNSPCDMPSFSLHSSLTDVEVRNYSSNSMITLFCSYPTPQFKITFISSFPLYSLHLMSGFHRVEAFFPFCDYFEATGSYDFIARGFFKRLSCNIDYLGSPYRNEIRDYAGTAEIRTYDDEVVLRLPEGFYEKEVPTCIPRIKLK